PVRPGEDLLRHVWIHNYRIDRDVREVTRLILPGRNGTVGVAGYAINMPGSCRCVFVKSANGSITDRGGRSRARGIERDAKNRTVRQNAVVISDVDPAGLAARTGAEIEPDPDVAVVGARDGDTAK